MNEKYVSTRIKAVGSAKAVQGLMHDTRFTIPGYLRPPGLQRRRVFHRIQSLENHR